MLEAARIRRSTPDYAGTLADEHHRSQSKQLDQMTGTRQGLTMLMVIGSIVFIGIAAYTVWRIERSLDGSINRQIRRTEAMIGGIADGVMLVDRAGKSVFINKAATELLGNGRHETRQATGVRDELPAAVALATGKSIQDVTMAIDRGDKLITIAMSATPLYDEGRVAGVVATFRDITERRRLQEDMQSQAERAQILADAGAFFSSTIDPAWVTQAIAERVAEVLGDWAAVILKGKDSNDLQVAAIYHRDMASLGLAWSYIYRQPLTVGDGIIGQVVSTGYPALMTNVGTSGSDVTAEENVTSYHVPTMQLASLLILPLRTRREMLGALVIAAGRKNQGRPFCSRDRRLCAQGDLARRNLGKGARSGSDELEYRMAESQRTGDCARRWGFDASLRRTRRAAA